MLAQIDEEILCPLLTFYSKHLIFKQIPHFKGKFKKDWTKFNKMMGNSIDVRDRFLVFMAW